MMGCSVSPYQRGIKLAEEYDNCIEAYFEASEKVDEDFALELPDKYTSRAAAIEEYLKLLRECYQTYSTRWCAIEEKEAQIRKKVKSTSDLKEFETGLATREMYVFVHEPDWETVEVSPVVLQKVRMIYPPKPNEMQISKDLVGHTLSEGKSNGYYPQSWRWIIDENSISDFKIISTEEDSKNRYTILTTMRLCSDTRAYDTKAQISYILDDLHDWTIEFVQSKGMDIVKTHRYDDCVKCYISRGWLIGNLIAENNCEIALEVAGRELNHSGEWITFCCIVPPHQQKVISNNDTDFRIDYVERP
jgi:hypothetical protein